MGKFEDKVHDCVNSGDTFFYFNKNELTHVSSEVRLLTNCRVIDLSDNRIESIDSDIGELNAVKILDLSRNNISNVPIEIGLLKSLESLGLSNNLISEIPVEIYNLAKLKVLKLDNNPITLPPIEIIHKGVSAVRSYLSSILESKQRIRLFEAKMLVVGEGSVGKTFLMNKMIYGKCEKETLTTEGIDIRKWEIKSEANEDFRVNFWDFGGQEIYHSTHQFFLTKRSLYLFIWTARTDDNLISFDYWLNVISLLGDDPPVIIVQNKIDEREKNIDEKLIKRKFPNVIAFYKISALVGTNLQSLIEHCKNEVMKLDHVGDTLPKVWHDIRLKLESLDKNFITFNEYKKICEDFGLSSGKSSYLSQYLHDLGVFLHFQRSAILKNIIFLKPEWATNAVYKLVDTKDIVRGFGRFSFKQLQHVWTDYPEENHIHLIELMKKFELCFQLGNTEEYIIPELLEAQNPVENLELRESFYFKYKYDFMPKGVISRFIVRTHDMIYKNQFWKNGIVIFRNGTYGTIVSDPFARTILIHIAGYNKKSLLSIIKREFDYIHESLNNLVVREILPCICQECKGSFDSNYFDYLVLKRHLGRNKTTITCPKSIEDIPIKSLLKDYEGNILLGDKVGNDHIKKLRKCLPGRQEWKKYEEICTSIFSYLFSENFGKYIYETQAKTSDGFQIRDLIVHNNFIEPTSFWAELKSNFSCKLIFCEFKNYEEELSTNTIQLSLKYLNKLSGNAIIIFSRKGIKPESKEYLGRCFRDGQLLIVLSDTDVINMVHEKMKGEDPTLILQDKYFDIAKHI